MWRTDPDDHPQTIQHALHKNGSQFGSPDTTSFNRGFLMLQHVYLLRDGQHVPLSFPEAVDGQALIDGAWSHVVAPPTHFARM